MAENEREYMVGEPEPRRDLATVVGNFIKNYIIDIFVVILLIVYLLKNIATVGVAEKDLLTLLADCAVTFFFAQALKVLLSRRGIMIGQNSEAFKKVYENYNNILHSCKTFIGNLDTFCNDINEKRLNTAQEEILLAHGVTYKQFISGAELNADYQKKGVKKALKVKIAYLKAKDLMAETDGTRRTQDLGRPIDKYLKSKNLTGVVMTVGATILFSYFKLKPIDGFSWEALIWSAVQVVYFLSKGVFSLVTSIMYIQGEYTNRIIMKTNYLQQFYNEYSNQNTEKEEVQNGK